MPIGIADRIAGYVTEAYKSVPRRGAEAGGLLLGGLRLGPVIDIFITGFEPIPCDYPSGPSFTASASVQAEFRAATGRLPAAEVVGYYRSHTRKSSGLEPSDQEIVDKVFPGLSGLVLLIKPSGVRTFSAGYFFFQTGRLEMRPVGSEFPFLVSVPGGTPPPAVPEPEGQRTPGPEFKQLLQESLAFADKPRAGSILQSSPKVEAVAAETADTSKRRLRLQWEIVAAGLMVTAALALLWWQYRGASGEDAVAVASTAPSRVAALGLAVRPGEGGWRVTWNPKSPAARNAVRGALDVTEDASHERIPLTASEIQDGAATYRPNGDDVIFRLDLVANDNSVAAETYRVILKPREAEIAAPPPSVKPTPKEAPKPEKKAETPPEATAPDYVESEVVSRVAPDIPDGIRPRITSPLPIDVRVSIDREGRVTRASAIQHEDGLVDYLAKRAVAAAKGWTFTPAKRGGKVVDSSRTIHFVFEQ